jgi:O-methyltransferase involved in polyketide biosynthesis
LQVSHVTADQFPGFASSRRDAYGLVTLLDVLEHVERGRQIEFLSRVGSMLAPGGRLICQVPNADSVVASRYRYIDWTHHISFTVESLEFLLHCAGLGTLETLEDNPNLRPSTLVPARAWARWLYRGLMRGLRRLEMGAEIGLPAARVLPLSKNIIAVATRLS